MSVVEAPDSFTSASSFTRPDPRLDSGRMSQADAEELQTRRAAEARLVARLRGWKPIVLWYSLWTVLLGIGAISSLASGQVGASLITLGITGLCAKYAHYLYNGGRRRVWFVIW